MNIIHSYKVNKLKRKLSLNQFSNVITEINYTLRSVYEENIGLADTETNRILIFNDPNIDSETFIPYEDLSEEIIISWISERSRELELHHEKIMDDYINPKIDDIIEEVPFWQTN